MGWIQGWILQTQAACGAQAKKKKKLKKKRKGGVWALDMINCS